MGRLDDETLSLEKVTDECGLDLDFAGWPGSDMWSGKSD